MNKWAAWSQDFLVFNFFLLAEPYFRARSGSRPHKSSSKTKHLNLISSLHALIAIFWFTTWLHVTVSNGPGVSTSISSFRSTVAWPGGPGAAAAAQSQTIYDSMIALPGRLGPSSSTSLRHEELLKQFLVPFGPRSGRAPAALAAVLLCRAGRTRGFDQILRQCYSAISTMPGLTRTRSLATQTPSPRPCCRGLLQLPRLGTGKKGRMPVCVCCAGVCAAAAAASSQWGVGPNPAPRRPRVAESCRRKRVWRANAAPPDGGEKKSKRRASGWYAPQKPALLAARLQGEWRRGTVVHGREQAARPDRSVRTSRAGLSSRPRVCSDRDSGRRPWHWHVWEMSCITQGIAAARLASPLVRPIRFPGAFWSQE